MKEYKLPENLKNTIKSIMINSKLANYTFQEIYQIIGLIDGLKEIESEIPNDKKE